MDRAAAELAAAVDVALPGWVERSVERVHTAWAGRPDPAVAAAAAEAGQRAAAEVGPPLRRLLEADVDRQWTNPLSLLRAAVRHPTEVLRGAGVPPVERDEYDQAHFPDDDYDLTPRTFADVDPALADAGIAWGAAKAKSHLDRHRPARPGAPGRVLAYVPDLMDRSKVAGARADVVFVGSPEEAAAEAGADDVVVVDLGRPGVLEALPAMASSGARVVGFGSHVDRATLERASAAGCQALPRSRFFAGLVELPGPETPEAPSP